MSRLDKKPEKDRSLNRPGRALKVLLPLLITILFGIVLFLLYRPIFVLNDDMLIEGILSGSYGGVYPYAYYFSVQLGLLLAGLYKVFPGVAWLGVFYCACIFGSFYVILQAIFQRMDDWKKLCACVAAELVTYGALVVPQFVFLHYTVIAAILGAAGLFLFGIVREKKHLVAPIVLFLLCYLVRENVFFMLLPFIGICYLALIWRGGRKVFREYFPYAAMFVLLFVLAFVWNRSLVLTSEWKDYVEYNNTRTDVYDYLGIPDDQGALDYYVQQGISMEELQIYQAYDLALLENHSGRTGLEKIAELGSKRRQEQGWMTRLREAVAGYKYRLTNWEADSPYIVLTICLYGALLLLIKDFGEYLFPLLMMAYRSMFWVYLLYKGRYPERVTASLFLMEIALLLAMIIRQLKEYKEKDFRYYGERVLLLITGFALVATACASLWSIKGQLKDLDKINQQDQPLYTYMEKHTENKYYLDVYATVYRTKPAFEPTGGKQDNYMILGGWILEHPLYLKRLSGYQSAAEVLQKNANSYFVKKEGVGLDTKVLEDYLQQELLLVDTLEVNGTVFHIYGLQK